LLIGGDKTGNNRFYDEYIPIADRLYDIYLWLAEDLSKPITAKVLSYFSGIKCQENE
jgi:hypothetical protein